MAIGLGAPRKSIRLVRDGETILVQSGDGSLDVTDRLNAYSESKVQELDFLGDTCSVLNRLHAVWNG
ncbi:hypothetical protein SPWS13_4166 [Shewanella putrefaciens]|nr:hypothetical protein SPWS13_4166 [Shewanella putrefaciens]